MKEFIEIPFGAKDSELGGWEYNIPEGYAASIESGKIIVKKEESEDERVRKGIFKALSKKDARDILISQGMKVSDALAWLERQKPTTDIQNITWEDIEKIGEFINTVQNENLNGIGAECLYTDVLERFLDEKQTKQKVINDTDEDIVEQKPADKVEPKFKVGDWVVREYEYTKDIITINQVVDVKRIDDEDFGYTLDDETYFSGSLESSYHLWTIQDAKDGDVLVAHECIVLFKEIDGLNIKCYCTYHFMNNPSFNVNTLQNKSAFHPATKEQRDLLFQKMYEAGYEWDAEKKELKKVEQNSAWSEEDEENLNQLHKLIVKKAYEEYEIDTEDETLYGKWLKLDNWLKSLRTGNAWKPSKEQIQALEYQVHSTYEGSWQYKASKELLEQLKKL